MHIKFDGLPSEDNKSIQNVKIFVSDAILFKLNFALPKHNREWVPKLKLGKGGGALIVGKQLITIDF